MFESPGCSYCEVQKQGSGQFSVSFWLERPPFGCPTNTDRWPNQFGIEIAPSILILSKDKQEAMPISTGIINISQLKDRIKRAVLYMSGEKQPEEWFDDQGMFDPLKFVDKKPQGRGKMKSK